MEELLDLKKPNGVKEEKIKKHIPSKIQADTLFNFCSKLEYLEEPIKTKMLSARYCEENIEYLNLEKIKRISFPMKCFCDINMHKLEEHLSWYGYYGLAFKKEWGMKKGIQPVQYVNPDTELIKDFSESFIKALKIDKTKQTESEKVMKNYLLHQLMYFKPYSGKMKNRNNQEEDEKCFTDECEWRFIPNVSRLGYKQIYFDEQVLNAGNLNDISNSMIGKEEISLDFSYDDLKYIIVRTKEDVEKISDTIMKMKIKKEQKRLLISKIIAWDLSGGDF